jgi:BMFP domain-containing protein YqiC
MAMKESTLELRNLLGDAVKGVKCCGVCGKPESRNTKQVNENCPAHARAIAEDLPAKFRMLSKALGHNLMDFVTKEKFNAQLENIREKLTKAREEHDAFTPETAESTRTKTSNILAESLKLLGVDVGANPEEGSNGVWPPLVLAENIKATILKLRDEVAAVVEGKTEQTEAESTATATGESTAPEAGGQ